MSSKTKTLPPGRTGGRAASPARTVRDSTAARRRRRRTGANPLVWLAGVGAIVLILIGLSVWDSGALARPVPASRTENAIELLPLAQAVRPLRGSHDMALIPESTPAPKPAPAGVALPAVNLPSASYDFGRIRKQPDARHIFAIQNTGTADLVISNLVTSCGCTTAEASSSVIPPGQRADLTITFDPDFHPIQGEATRLVWFATNDPIRPWIEVRITADVE